jgi:hypothetical protein
MLIILWLDKRLYLILRSRKQDLSLTPLHHAEMAADAADAAAAAVKT